MVHVRNPDAAGVFVESWMRRLLALFVGRPRALSEVTVAADLDIKRLHYLAQKLCRLGLLEVVGERRRAGRPIKLYRASGDAFFIDADNVPRPFGEGLLLELGRCIARDTMEHVAGMVFTADAEGRPVGQVVRREGVRTRAPEMWRILRLRPTDAEALKKELEALLTQYEKRAVTDGKIYLAHAAVALRDEQAGPVDNQDQW